MSDAPQFAPGSTAAFAVLETFSQPGGGTAGLVRSDGGDVVFIQLIAAGHGGGGGDMVSARLNSTTVTFTVEHFFPRGYLILGTALGDRYFATIVEPASS